MVDESEATGVEPGTTRVRVLRTDDVETAAQLITDAFQDEPQTVAFLPDPQQRRAVMLVSARRLVRAQVPYATAFGAEIDGCLVGVALWYPPNVRPSPWRGRWRWIRDAVAARSTLASALPAAAARARRDGAAFARTLIARQRHLRTASAPPVWYLAVLGTSAASRGRGVARALLEQVLDRCDADGIAAWLETTEKVNVGIYERFGFETVTRIPGSGALPDLWMMRREPLR